MTKVFLKQEVKDRINAKLRDLMTIRQDGQCEYPSGWDDAIVATVLGGTVVENSVKRLRQANFGRLYKPPRLAEAKPVAAPAPDADVIAELRADIEKLEQKVRGLRKWVKAFDPKWEMTPPLMPKE